MNVEYRTTLSVAEKEDITRLWNAEYPAVIKYGGVADFEAFLDGLTEHRHFLIFGDEGAVDAWLLVFTRDADRWFSIIVNSAVHGRGFGRILIDEARKSEPVLNGWVAADNSLLRTDGSVYPSPLDFYRKLGFAVFDDITLDKNGFRAVKIRWTS